MATDADTLSSARYSIKVTSAADSIEHGLQQIRGNSPRIVVDANQSANFKIALDRVTGLEVIATKLIEVVYLDGTDLPLLLQDYQLEVDMHFTAINTAFTAVSEFSDITPTIERLNKDARIKNARLQVIDPNQKVN